MSALVLGLLVLFLPIQGFFRNRIGGNIYNIKVAFKLEVAKNPFNLEVAQDFPVSDSISELPDSFVDAISRAGKRTASLIRQGRNLCRVDFDTSVGDQTSTILKNTMPMLKEFVKIMDSEFCKTEDSEAATTRVLKIFFPDMGAAMLARRDWKVNTNESEVPQSVITANIYNDMLSEKDSVVLILCPQYSEVDAVTRVMDMCSASNVPCVLINPNLVNMDQGYGVREYRWMHH